MEKYSSSIFYFFLVNKGLHAGSIGPTSIHKRRKCGTVKMKLSSFKKLLSTLPSYFFKAKTKMFEEKYYIGEG